MREIKKLSLVVSLRESGTWKVLQLLAQICFNQKIQVCFIISSILQTIHSHALPSKSSNSTTNLSLSTTPGP